MSSYELCWDKQREIGIPSWFKGEGCLGSKERVDWRDARGPGWGQALCPAGSTFVGWALWV